ncbi:MAG: D-amino acid aminotransferase [Desulfobacteraceae bacterium]|nr:D-amino acid aminotransferase [Desulfobacteraceae bacterium]
MPELAYINGTICAIEEAKVPIEDRGYQFGDAVYEFLATYNGKIFALDDHFSRLERSLRELKFPTVDLTQLKSASLELLKRSEISSAGIYIQISRGVAPRDHKFPVKAQPQLVMTIRELAQIPQAVRTNGARVISMEDARWGRCDIKSVQLLANVLAKQKAIEADADEAILISPAGNVREAASSNVFIAINGELHTHPLTRQILPGITRKITIEICKEEGIKVNENLFTKEQMLSADEVFLTGTVTEVLPVCQIDGKLINDGRPGPIAEKLYKRLCRRTGQ